MVILVSFQLDIFFNDVVGLSPCQNLSVATLPERKPRGSTTDSTNSIPIDNLPLWFSKPFLFPSIPHLKDLCELLRELAHNDGKLAVTSSAKKVRPNIIRKISFSGSFSGDNTSPWSGTRAGAPTRNIGIKERLIDAFFHQHKDLQQLCELVVDRSLKNFTKTASQTLIHPNFKNGATSFEDYLSKSPRMTLNEYKMLLTALDVKANEEATRQMSSDFNRIIRGSLQLLAHADTKPKVVEVASTLAINHATQKGKKTFGTLITEEKKKLVDEFIRKQNKLNAGVPLKRSSALKDDQLVSSNSNLHILTNLTEILRSVQESDDTTDVLKNLSQVKTKATDHLRQHFVGGGSSQEVVDFELQIISLLKVFFHNPSQVHLFQAIIEVGEVLSLLGKLGYVNTSNLELESLLCHADNMMIMIDAVKHCEALSYDAIGNLLFLMIDGSILCHRALEKALLSAVKSNDSKVVAKIVLEKLDSSRFGVTNNNTGGLVIMVRLQKLLSKDDKSQSKAKLV